MPEQLTLLELDQYAPAEMASAASELSEKHRLLRVVVTRQQLLRLAQKGLTAADSAKIVGISAATARDYYSEPAFRRDVLEAVEKAFGDVDAAYASKRKTLHELLETQAYESFSQLVGMLEEDDLHPALRMKINQDFLDRHQDTAQISKAKFIFDAKDLKRAAKVAQEMDNVIPMRRTG